MRWQPMVRRGVAAACLAAGLMLVSTPAGAGGGPKVKVRATFTGTGSFSGCNSDLGLFVTDDGSLDGPQLRDATLHFDFCYPDTRVGVLPVSGTFALGLRHGMVTGVLEGQSQSFPATPCGYPFTFSLTITAGTDRFANASGVLSFSGCLSTGVATATGTLMGTIRA